MATQIKAGTDVETESGSTLRRDRWLEIRERSTEGFHCRLLVF